MQRDITAFLIDCQSRRLSPRTVEFYRDELGHLRTFLRGVQITRPTDITPTHLRAYLLHLERRGRNPGGCHAAYRATRRFLRWYEAEYEPDSGWRNPIKRVQAPKVPDAPLEPVPLDHVRKMLATCAPRTLWGDRAKAVIMCLLDTGLRASEFLALDVGDVDMKSGATIVRHGKGDKRRLVFLGAKARRALIRYLRHRPEGDMADPLWTNKSGWRMSYNGLKSLVRRRAEAAGVPYPGLHAFRRAFTTLAYRNGANVLELRDLLGHADLSVLRRYLRLNEDDLRRAHERSGPVDNML